MSVIIKGKNPRKPHTVRYWVDGRKRERSFVTAREARDFQIKTDHDVRAHIFVDDRLGREDFGQAVDQWIARHAVTESTRAGYQVTANAWVKPRFAGRTIAQVAADRDTVLDLLTSDMGHLSVTRRRQARSIITGTITEAVRAGKITQHQLHGIDVKDNGRATERNDFVFPSHAQVVELAKSAGIVVWLMRGCGLRIEEALGVHREDFQSRTTLRLTSQASRDGRTRGPLKHRKRGEYRDVIVPGWLWDMVKDLPDGPLCPGVSTPYARYEAVRVRLGKTAAAAGIPAGFRAHSLRHAFVSALLSRGVPITDVARWVGHKDIRETYQTYSRFMPEAEDRALGVLAAEYAEWSA